MKLTFCQHRLTPHASPDCQEGLDVRIIYIYIYIYIPEVILLHQCCSQTDLSHPETLSAPLFSNPTFSTLLQNPTDGSWRKRDPIAEAARARFLHWEIDLPHLRSSGPQASDVRGPPPESRLRTRAIADRIAAARRRAAGARTRTALGRGPSLRARRVSPRSRTRPCRDAREVHAV